VFAAAVRYIDNNYTPTESAHYVAFSA